MKILIISDVHGNVENIEKLSEQAKNADLVFFGGDFAKFNCPETGKPALEALLKNSGSIFAVLGNCDEPDFISEIEDADICVQKSMVFKDGLVIAGSGGGSKFSGDTPFERTEDELVQDFDVIKNSLSQIADDDGKCSSLVLIMHNPPKDTKTDVIPGGIHVGSQKLREFIENVQPVLVVTGHIHESAGIDKIGESTVINPGALMEGKYALAELKKTAGKWVVKSAELCSL
ncbi:MULTISPECIES: metallophosphoesterase family protein [unclassified Treponema]|uniref:metallophosphoesterase family protein n=1 Tax=unclassified Treponema TaxID=2638727 RepID=UPI0025DCEBD8|nr:MULTISPECIES: metallophosphoesterase family protein [unclassified Treponema]